MIRKANPKEAEIILQLIEIHAQNEQVLFRTLDDVIKNIDEFFVFEQGGQITGTCSLRDGWNKTVEIRSLVVHPQYYRQGFASALIKQCIEEALLMEYENLFVFTYAVSLFEKLGFKVVDKSSLPQKIWLDCRACSKQDCCDETAMLLPLIPLKNSVLKDQGLAAGS